MLANIVLQEDTLQSIKEHLLANWPNEAGGFVLEGGEFVPCENIHDSPAEHFKFSAIDFATYYEKAAILIHSHCFNKRKVMLQDPRTPSYKDFVSQKRTKIPWLIFATDGTDVSDPVQLPRIAHNNYTERQFMWFVNDCYTIVQDWYLHERSIALPDYVEKDVTEVTQLREIFLDALVKANFVEINLQDITDGDLLLMDNQGLCESHLGIFANGKVLHQSDLSECVSFENFGNRVKRVYRYAG